MTAVLQEVDSWSVEDRIRLVQAVWDQIVQEGAHPPLTDGQRAELDRRLKALENAPDEVVTWQEVENHLRRTR